jgi:hypothetical protein
MQINKGMRPDRLFHPSLPFGFLTSTVFSQTLTNNLKTGVNIMSKNMCFTSSLNYNGLIIRSVYNMISNTLLTIPK